MTGIGKLVECIEDCEIVQELHGGITQEINFYKGALYTALLESSIFVIDRSHKNIEFDETLFKKHFILK